LSDNRGKRSKLTATTNIKPAPVNIPSKLTTLKNTAPKTKPSARKLILPKIEETKPMEIEPDINSSKKIESQQIKESITESIKEIQKENQLPLKKVVSPSPSPSSQPSPPTSQTSLPLQNTLKPTNVIAIPNNSTTNIVPPTTSSKIKLPSKTKPSAKNQIPKADNPALEVKIAEIAVTSTVPKQPLNINKSLPNSDTVTTLDQHKSQKIIQILAIADQSKDSIVSKLKLSPTDIQSLSTTLKSVATFFSPGLWRLKETVFDQVQLDWPEYTKEERDIVQQKFSRRKILENKPINGRDEYTYEAIETIEQYRSYKNDYAEKYSKYLDLYYILTEQEKHWKSLDEKWKKVELGNEKRDLAKQIEYEYKKHHAEFTQMKKNYIDLHQQLTAIKQHIKDYVKKHEAS